MRNVRREGDDLVYDCTSKNCGTPGEPHRIPVAAVMASLEAALQEFAHIEDPRAEALDVALQLLYQNMYDSSGEQFPTKPLPWAESFSALMKVLYDKYAEANLAERRVAPSRDKKELLN